MLHLLQPIWLLASTAMIVPVIIHLWNVKQGKILKIGSISLLTQAAQEHARSMRLTELFLLLLRCLLIFLISLMLAKPYWQNNTLKQGWVLMAEKDAQEAYTHFKPQIDSLIKVGYELHVFEEGFEKKNLQNILKDQSDTSDTHVSYWQLVKQLDRQLLPGTPVYLFTNNKLSRFAGNRPEINMSLAWQTFTDKDSVKNYISKAYMSSDDSIVIKMGESNPAGTMYHEQTIAVDQPKQKNFLLDVFNGKLSVSYNNATPVVIDTTTLHVTIFTDKYLNDAKYVEAAIRSIQQVSKRKINIRNEHNAAFVPAKQDWLFWLSAQPVPSNLKAGNVFMYEAGDVITDHSFIHTDGPGTIDGIELFKKVSFRQNNAKLLWQDGFGTALLTKENNNSKNLYRFYSRFDPSWNDLVWSASFPAMIYGLIDEATQKEPADSNDQRTIGATEIKLNTSINKTNYAAIAGTTDASRILWMIVFIIFFAERFFSFKTKKEKANA